MSPFELSNEEVEHIVEGSPFIFVEIDKMNDKGVFHGFLSLKKENVSRYVIFLIPNGENYNMFISHEIVKDEQVDIEQISDDIKEKISNYLKNPWKEIEEWEKIPINF